MIASVRGTLLRKGTGYVVVEVGGLGLRVNVPARVVDGPYVLGRDITLVTHLHIRENEMALYGFLTQEELELFDLLLQVPGIGPKAALSAISFMPDEALRQAIANGDTAALLRIPGIGKKSAQQLVLNLRDKVGLATSPAGEPWLAITAADMEVIEGLTSLGYSVAEAQQALRALPDDKLALEDKLLIALRYLGGSEA